MVRILRREFAADLIALAYVLAFFAWLALRTPGTPLTARVSDLAFYPLGLAVGWAFARNALVPKLDRRTRLAWGLLSGAAVLLWLIGVTWPHMVQYFGPAAWPGWTGLAEILQHLLLLAAILTFPNQQFASRDRTRFRFDVLLVVVAGLVLAFHFGLLISRGQPPVGPVSLAIAQSVLDWITLIAAAVGVLHKRDTTTRMALFLLFGSIGCYLFANNMLAQMPEYRLGDAVDGMWFAAWVCRWLAARFAWHRYAGTPAPAFGLIDARTPAYHARLFPYVMLAGSFILIVLQIIVGDGQYAWLLAVSAALMAGLLLLRQIVELRESRRLFAAQLAQEARFRSLVQHSSDVVLIVDNTLRVSYVSPAADLVFGAGTVAAGTRLSDVFSANDMSGLAPLFANADADAGRVEGRIRTLTGDLRDVEVVWRDLRHDEAVAGFVLNCRDITDRNELERQLRHAQKLDAVGHLAGGLAHDFNNVLTAIRSYADMLRDELPPQPGATADLNNIQRAVERASTVTKKLLAFSRKEPVHLTVLDLNAVLFGLQPLLRQLMTDQVTITLACDPDLWRVKADQGQMEQVIVNLATNARDAMPDGGLLRIVTSNRTIAGASPATGGLPPGDYASIAVTDRGTGMTDEVRARIFEPFFTTKPKDRGIGLGLAMVHGIVTFAGGHISVDSAPGRGTTMEVLLPRTTEGPAAGATRAAASDPA